MILLAAAAGEHNGANACCGALRLLLSVHLLAQNMFLESGGVGGIDVTTGKSLRLGRSTKDGHSVACESDVEMFSAFGGVYLILHQAAPPMS